MNVTQNCDNKVPFVVQRAQTKPGEMFSYIVALAALLLFFYGPISQYLSPAPRRMQRTPRPPINEDLLALELNSSSLGCPHDSYSVHIYSKQPLVLYFENFLSPQERAHLLEIR
jgi:prolyl 4-hydroxylase